MSGSGGPMVTGVSTLALRLHRFARRLHFSGHERAARLVTAFTRMLISIEISPTAEIDPTVCIQHGQGLVIGDGAVVGPGTWLFQGVTLGLKDGEFPVVGAHVRIWPGAKVIGGVHIGDGAVVGANAVVLHDVAPGEVVGGVPARVLRPGGSGR